MFRLRAGLNLPGGYNLSPVEDFDFKIAMDLSGGGLLWYARS